MWRAQPLGDDLLLSVDGAVLGSWDQEPEAARQVRGDMEIWAAAHAAGCVVVHACVVAHRGVALVLPGASMVGKTTMAVALAQAGAQYCSDEFAILDDRGLVQPYLRCPAVRRSTPVGPVVEHVDLTELGATVCGMEMPVGLVAELRYDAARRNLEISDMTPARTALSLMANAVAARIQPDRVLAAAVAVARGARGVIGMRGPADQAAAALLDLTTSFRDRRAS